MAAKKNLPVTEYNPAPQCAYDGCGFSSYVRIKTKTGWANLCPLHYDQHFKRQADETCKRLGLKTPAEMREWVKKNNKGLKRFSDAVMPEKSEDEIEIEAIPF